MTVYEPQGDPIPSGTEAVDPAAQGRPDLGSFLSGLSAEDQQRFHDKVTRLHFGDAGLSYDDAVDVTMKNFTPNVPAIDTGHQPTPDEILELWTDTPGRAEQMAHVGVIAEKVRALHTSNLAEKLATLPRNEAVSPDTTTAPEDPEVESLATIETNFDTFMNKLSITSYAAYESARQEFSFRNGAERRETIQDIMRRYARFLNDEPTLPRDEAVSPDAPLSVE
jgi:hypothetical protein